MYTFYKNVYAFYKNDYAFYAFKMNLAYTIIFPPYIFFMTYFFIVCFFYDIFILWCISLKDFLNQTPRAAKKNFLNFFRKDKAEKNKIIVEEEDDSVRRGYAGVRGGKRGYAGVRGVRGGMQWYDGGYVVRGVRGTSGGDQVGTRNSFRGMRLNCWDTMGV